MTGGHHTCVYLPSRKVEVQLCYGKYWKPHHTLTVTSLISFILSFHLYIYNERLYILSFYYWKLSTIYCNVNNINYHCSNTLAQFNEQQGLVSSQTKWHQLSTPPSEENLHFLILIKSSVSCVCGCVDFLWLFCLLKVLATFSLTFHKVSYSYGTKWSISNSFLDSL